MKVTTNPLFNRRSVVLTPSTVIEDKLYNFDEAETEDNTQYFDVSLFLRKFYQNNCIKMHL